jgi:hypothetical protein
MGVPCVELTGSDDPLVTQAALDLLRRERPSGSSHIVEGSGDALKSEIDWDSLFGEEEPYDEIRRFMCEKSSGLSHVEDGGGDAHEQVSAIDLAEIFAVWHERLCLVLGCNRDCRMRLHVIPHPGMSDGAEGTLRGTSASLFIHSSKTCISVRKLSMNLSRL